MAVIDARGSGAPYQAHNLLGYIRRLFGWAIYAAPTASKARRAIACARSTQSVKRPWDCRFSAIWNGAHSGGRPRARRILMVRCSDCSR